MRSTHTISGITSLQRAFWLKRGTRIILALPSFSIVQQEHLEMRFNRCLAYSGGEFLILALIVSLAGCIVFDAAHGPHFVAHPLQLLAGNFLVCFASSLLGKLFAQARARTHLADLIRTVAKRLREDQSVSHGNPSIPLDRSFAMNRNPVRRIL